MIKKVEHLLRSYKENKSEVEMLTYRLDLNAIDYSKDKVQTSNISSLDDVVIAREKKLIQLKKDIHTTEALIKSLGERDYKIINDFYILERSQTKIGADLEITEDAVWKAKYVILKKLANLLEDLKEDADLSIIGKEYLFPVFFKRYMNL